MLSNFIAEIDKLIRQPATWILAGVWLALNQVFNYLIPYTSYLNSDNERAAEQVLASTLPENLVLNSIDGFPVFAGAIALILGALVVGNEYNWGTLKTVLIQRSGRMSLYVSKLATLAVAMLCIVFATFAMNALTSSVIASIESEAINWPSLGELIQGFGAGFLIAAMWCLLGAALAVLFQSLALPIGLGLVWALAIENLIRSVAAPLLDSFDTLQKGLPGVNAGSLVAALGGQTGETPGIVAAVDGTQATLVLMTYAVAFALIAGFVLLRRDVA
jgi:ABC-type transport system involved in multi-copper enzyme maturation permease subunit